MEETKQIEYYEGFNLRSLFSYGPDPFIICVYHNDVDGIVSKFNIGKHFNLTQSIPADYNKTIKFDTNYYNSIITTRPKIAFVVDFCLHEEEYDLLIESGFKIVVIDHHTDGRINILKQNKYQNDIIYLFSDQFSAAMLTAYYVTCIGLNRDVNPIDKSKNTILNLIQIYVSQHRYRFLKLVDARDRGIKTNNDYPTYLHTYFKSFKFSENSIYKVYKSRILLNDALTIGHEIYMTEISEITNEINKTNWNIVKTTKDGQNSCSLLQIEPTKSLNATNALAVANKIQIEQNKPSFDGVIVQYHSERMSKVYNLPVYHVEIRMNDNNEMHMGEFLKDVCDISGGGHKNAAGGDLFSTTLDEVFK